MRQKKWLTTDPFMASMLVMCMQTMADRVRWLRETAGIGSREAGRMVGLSNAYFYSLESGTSAPRAGTALDMADLFGCDVRWLVTGQGEPPDPDAVRAAVERARVVQRATGTDD